MVTRERLKEDLSITVSISDQLDVNGDKRERLRDELRKEIISNISNEYQRDDQNEYEEYIGLLNSRIPVVSSKYHYNGEKLQYHSGATDIIDPALVEDGVITEEEYNNLKNRFIDTFQKITQNDYSSLATKFIE